MRTPSKLIILGLTAVAFGAGCASANKGNKTEATDTAAAANAPSPAVQIAAKRGDNIVTTLKFDKSKSQLTPDARGELARAISDARARGDIDDVTVVVWSDMEYPGADKKLPKTQVKLADRRANNIEDYLSKDLQVSSYRVETHNMSKKPNYLSEFLRTADADLKEQLTAQGVAPENPAMGAGRASSALVFVKLKE